MKLNPNDADFYRTAFLTILATELPCLLLVLCIPAAYPMLMLAASSAVMGMAFLIQWRRCTAEKERIRAEGERRQGRIAGRQLVRCGRGVYYNYKIECADGSGYETGRTCTNWNGKLRTLEVELYVSGGQTAVYVQRKEPFEKGKTIGLIGAEKAR